MSHLQHVFSGLAGRAALVTGASSGLGRQFALTLARAGMDVAVAARRVEALQDLTQEVAQAAKELKLSPAPRVFPTAMDVTKPESVSAAVARVYQEFGPSLSVVVNNAGVAVDKPSIDVTPEEWDFVLNTNLRGAWLVSQAAAKATIALQKQGGSAAAAAAAVGLSIVNIASIAGLRQGARITPYAVSKAALLQLTKVLALEWAKHGIRVNALAPGYFKTEMNAPLWDTPAGKVILSRIPTRRIGDLGRDLDGALLLLASDAGRHMTGAVISVDGGHAVASL